MKPMSDASFFTSPVHTWQRQYEALRASFVERLPARVVADRFGYKPAYVRLLRHQFMHGKLDFSEPVPEGKVNRRRVTAEVRKKIRDWREKRLSAGEITELLSEDGVDISVRTVERVLAEEGFPKLPRRARKKVGLTVKGAEIPARSEVVTLAQLDGQKLDCSGAGVFLFAPFLAQLDIANVVHSAKLPESRTIPALSYLLSFLTLKLLGTERWSHVGEHTFDPGLGLLAGLNVLPKCTALSTYAYSLDEQHILTLQKQFVLHAISLGLYDGSMINLDFHSAPHFGDESVLEKHWAGSRGRAMKAALSLFAQDAESKLILYTAADIRRPETDSQVLDFLSFWSSVTRGSSPTLVFDSRLTTYANLSQLNASGVNFITLRRRGKKLIKSVDKLTGWTRVHIPHVKRKYPNPQVHDSTVHLRDYSGDLRQLIVRGNGREKPTFLITNDFETPPDLLLSDYARRWRVENGIAEAVKFFHLNALSSSILVKIHFDIALTMVADTLYTMLARKLRGFEKCDAPKLYRSFVRGKASLHVNGSNLDIAFHRKAHNPVLRSVPWENLPSALPAFPGATLSLRFL
jgi:hypothetical protein